MDSEVVEQLKKDDEIDIQPYLDNSIEISKQVREVVLKIASNKIGFVQGFKQAQDCFSSQLNIPLQFDMDLYIKELDKIGDLELRLLAIQSGNFDDTIKNRLKMEALDSFYNNRNDGNRKNPLLQILREETDRINRELGEAANANVNQVKPIKKREMRND